MSERPHSILIAPVPFIDEAPSSWVRRTCALHRITYSTLLSSLGIEWTRDPDISMSADAFAQIASGTNVPRQRAAALKSIFRSVEALPKLRSLLHFDNCGRPAYKFCRRCLESDRHPYLRIAWRFEDWIVCSVHCELMQTVCPSCSASVRATLPCIKSKECELERLSACCAKCSTSLSCGSAVIPMSRDRSLSAIRAQRAVVSAVLRGYFYIDGYPRRLPLDFFLWLRAKYGWHGDRATGESVDANGQLTRELVNRLLQVFRSETAPVPIGGVVCPYRF